VRIVEQFQRDKASRDIYNIAALNDYRLSYDEATADHDREGCEGPTSDTSDEPTADHAASPDFASDYHAADNSHLSSW